LTGLYNSKLFIVKIFRMQIYKTIERTSGKGMLRDIH
jgi:hypothetical protein